MRGDTILVSLPNAAPGTLREFADTVAALAEMLDSEAQTWVSFPPPEAELWEETHEVELTGRFMGRHYAPTKAPR